MQSTLLTLGLLLFAPAQEAPAPAAAASDERYPASTALAEGVSPEALGKLDRLIQSFVDDEEVVGAELLVIKNGRSILHEAYGWRDREEDQPMETNGVFCVRSMTKPLIGTSILMLIGERKLKLGDRIGEYLPAFQTEDLRDITVEQLLTHTGGLPMSFLIGRDLTELESIQSVARLIKDNELEFDPGSRFNYSDQGTDTLTALIGVVTGAPPEDFVRSRLLEPLGMANSACFLAEDHPLRASANSKYAGARGNWSRYWSPEDPSLFPFFLGSQGLYSTVVDYARFTELWMQRGRIGRERVLRPAHVRKALSPGPHPMKGATGFPDLTAEYGYLMQLWTGPVERDAPDDGPERELVAFGHSGSDGTHVWAFPEQEALVLYFTQSRGTTTGLRVEEALGELLLGVPFDTNQVSPPFEQYLGYYREHEQDLYRAVIRDGEDLALEIMGKAVVPLSYAGEDRWKFRQNPGVVLAFQRSESGDVTGYRIDDHEEFRFEPEPELPSAEEVAARIAKAHRIDLLESVGPMRMHSTVEIEKLGLSGEAEALFDWPDRFRYDATVGAESEHVSFDGSQVLYSSTNRPVAAAEGARREALRLDNPLARFGDWKSWYPRTTVVQQLERQGKTLLVVRAGDASAPAVTLYIDAEANLVRQVDSMAYVDLQNRIGQRIQFDDFRDTGGMFLPYRIKTELANPMVGAIISTVTEVELNLELPGNAFQLD